MAITSINKINSSRNPAIELLRCIAMMMIIGSHLAVHGGVIYEKFCVNAAVQGILQLGGKLGVNIFVLISGYYSSDRFSTKRFLKILLQVEFYSIILFALSVIAGVAEITLQNCLNAFLPCLFGSGYWFVIAYLGLMVMAPLLNRASSTMTKNEHLSWLLFMLAILSVLPLIFGKSLIVQDYSVGNIGWFSIIYMVGRYLRLHPVKLYQQQKLTAILLLSSTVIFIVIKTLKVWYTYYEVQGIAGMLIRKAVSILGKSDMNAPFTIIISILYLILFQTIEIKPRKAIFVAASTTFGIYLLHDNPFFSEFMWECILKTVEHKNLWCFSIYTAVVIVLVFCVGMFIDRIRQVIVEQPLLSSPFIVSILGKVDRFIHT